MYTGRHIYYRGGPLTWGELLTHHATEDVGRQISAHRKSSAEQFKKLDGSVSEVVVSVDALRAYVEEGTDRTVTAIEDLQSDFNYQMDRAVELLVLQTERLTGMLAHLDAIHDTLQHPARVRAREYREHGLELLARGLLDKALERLLLSAEAYDTDFVVQYHIGKLYLQGKDDDCDLIDLEAACRHLVYAGRYAKSERDVPGADKFAALAYFYAAVAFYVRGNEAYAAGDGETSRTLTEEAVRRIESAIKLNDTLADAHYHRSKFAALLADERNMEQYFGRAIAIDPHYGIQVCTDPDFGAHRTAYLRAIEDRCDQLRRRIAKGLLSARMLKESVEEWQCPNTCIADMRSVVGQAESAERKGGLVELHRAERALVVTPSGTNRISRALRADGERKHSLTAERRELEECAERLIAELNTLPRKIEANRADLERISGQISEAGRLSDESGREMNMAVTILRKTVSELECEIKRVDEGRTERFNSIEDLTKKAAFILPALIGVISFHLLAPDTVIARPGFRILWSNLFTYLIAGGFGVLIGTLILAILRSPYNFKIIPAAFSIVPALLAIQLGFVAAAVVVSIIAAIGESADANHADDWTSFAVISFSVLQYLCIAYGAYFARQVIHEKPISRPSIWRG